MIKLLIIFLILIMILMLIALRYRRQIQTGLQVWRMYKQIKQKPKPAKTEVSQKINRGESLVRCARCGKWIAPSSAVNLRGNTVYCSTQCMEKAARLESLVDRK